MPCPRLHSRVSVWRAACVLPGQVSLGKHLGRVGMGRSGLPVQSEAQVFWFESPWIRRRRLTAGRGRS